MSAVLLLVAALTLAQAPSVVESDLDVVRDRYASAAYESALTYIGTLAPDRVTPRLEQYRALCLLALNRQQEGEAAFERLLRRAPYFVIAEGDISPRLFTIFREVRRRVLPELAREEYERGKALYDKGQHADAASAFTEVHRLLDDPDMTTSGGMTADLRQLAEGFLRLAETSAGAAPARRSAARTAAGETSATTADSRARAAGAPDAVAGPAGPAAAPPPTDVPIEGPVYSSADGDVAPPVVVSRQMPPWDPPAVMARFLEYRGEVTVVVDRQGRVVHTDVTRRTIPSYDNQLLDATEDWRFEPARRSGSPVNYRLTYEFVLAPVR